MTYIQGLCSNVDVWFGVGIFIYNYFECFLICRTTRELFWVLVNDYLLIFDVGGWVKKFNNSENNDMFLCNIYSLFFCYCRKLQSYEYRVVVVDNFYCFYICDSAMVRFEWVYHFCFIDIFIFRIFIIVGIFRVSRGGGIILWTWLSWYTTYVEKLKQYYVFRVLHNLVGRIRN